MHKFLFLILPIALFAAFTEAHAQAAGDSLIFLEKADRPPVFPGCELFTDSEALLRCFDAQLGSFLGENLNYPPDARAKNEQGTVYLEVIIDSSGHIVDIRNTKPENRIHPSLEKEAIRVMRKLPVMKPAVHEGKPVAVKYAIPLSFKLG